MAYICPRDRSKLLWKDFLHKGRWYCRSCSGTLVFEKNLKALPEYKDLDAQLKQLTRTKSELDCPACGLPMNQFPVSDVGVKFDIDQCGGCGSFWFDAGEIALLDKSNRSNALINLDAIFAKRFKEDELRIQRIHRITKIVFLALSGFFVLKIYPIAHEYNGGTRRAIHPMASALLAFFLTCLYTVNHRYFLRAIFPVPFLLFITFLIWAARF